MYGNTYHTAEIWINEKYFNKCLYQYGYGETCVQTAHEMLVNTGHEASTYHNFRKMLNNPNHSLTIVDVERKKDL